MVKPRLRGDLNKLYVDMYVIKDHFIVGETTGMITRKRRHLCYSLVKTMASLFLSDVAT